MHDKLRFLWHHHRPTFLAFLGAALVTAFFIIRMGVFSIYWADPAHHNQPPEGWMTPRYIAYSWEVEPLDITTALGVTNALGKHPSLQQIASARGIPLADLLAELAPLLKTLQQGPAK